MDNVDNVDDFDDVDDGVNESNEGLHQKSRVTTMPAPRPEPCSMEHGSLRLQDCRSLAPLGHVTTPL